MYKPVSTELVAEALRFCVAALRRKADELDQAVRSAESPAHALAAISMGLLTDSLLELAQDPLRLAAEGGTMHPGTVAEALEGFGSEADALRAMLAEQEAEAAE